MLLHVLLEISMTRMARGGIDGFDLEKALSSASEAISDRQDSNSMVDGDFFPDWLGSQTCHSGGGSTVLPAVEHGSSFFEAERVIARLSRQLLAANSRRVAASVGAGSNE